jgi:hypothetical protein
MIMHTTYRLQANELNEDFINSLKALFHDKTIEIAVSDAVAQQDNNTPPMPRKAGALAGRIKIGKDFDTPLPDFDEYQ